MLRQIAAAGHRRRAEHRQPRAPLRVRFHLPAERAGERIVAEQRGIVERHGQADKKRIFLNRSGSPSAAAAARRTRSAVNSSPEAGSTWLQFALAVSTTASTTVRADEARLSGSTASGGTRIGVTSSILMWRSATRSPGIAPAAVLKMARSCCFVFGLAWLSV
ncbi:MAG: hypothetical protein PHO07_18475 [Pirellulales bacterium]|nr:hypothetical protein [Pirellulales bacterium]